VCGKRPRIGDLGNYRLRRRTRKMDERLRMANRWSGERRSSFEATNVTLKLGQTEQALNLGEEARQLAFEVRMPLARIDKMQELFADQIFERADEPEAMPHGARRVALRNPLPVEVSC
jgi:hypothetical protein